MGESVTSTSASPPTRRVLDVLERLAAAPQGATSSELARGCGISTSTCALVLAELESRRYVARREDRRYVLGSGLFSIVHGLRTQYPLLDIGRHALEDLSATVGAACSLSRIEPTGLTVVDIAGHSTDEQNAVGQRISLAAPFGSVAMAWRDADAIDRWLRASRPRMTVEDMQRHRNVLSAIRKRGYGVWRFDESVQSLRDRLDALLESADIAGEGATVGHRLSVLLTQTSLESITDVLESRLRDAEFIVVPIFGADRQPEYQIEIRLDPGASDDLTLERLGEALTRVTALLTRPAATESPVDLGPGGGAGRYSL